MALQNPAEENVATDRIINVSINLSKHNYKKQSTRLLKYSKYAYYIKV